jgi:hypothetical protein
LRLYWNFVLHILNTIQRFRVLCFLSPTAPKGRGRTVVRC